MTFAEQHKQDKWQRSMHPCQIYNFLMPYLPPSIVNLLLAKHTLKRLPASISLTQGTLQILTLHRRVNSRLQRRQFWLGDLLIAKTMAV